MKKIWMVMLFGIMLLMAKSNNVYAETYETDLSQYNVGDNILQTTFEINTDEECEYEIVESGTFHNGHAVVMMEERSDEEADEESGDEELFLGYINDKLELRCNLTEMFGCDTEQNQWFTWDDLGNCLIGSDLLLLRDGQHYIKLSENDSITYSKDGYYIFSIYNKSGYQHKENEYGLFNYNGKILMKGTETELPLAINEFENSMSGWRSYGSLFRCDGGFYNVETGQIISPDFPHGLEWFGEADHAKYLLAGDDGWNLRVYDSVGNKVSEFAVKTNFDRILGAKFISTDHVATAYAGKATLYDLNGNVIFSNADTEEIIVMNISPRDDGYSVCLLKGTVSEENYITILDNQGQMCFEPIACNVGIMDTPSSYDNDAVYEEYIGDLLSDDGIMTVPNEEETICVNLKGEKVLSIEYELDEAFRDGWLSLGRAYSDEDANVYHYIEKYATSESDWDGQDTTEYIEESSADTNIQNGENNQEETNTTTQDTNISTENTTEYILPDSDSRYISENELGGMSSEQLRLARNEIFARHGRKFKDAQLQEYFNTKSWYSPQYDADSFDENMEQILNQYELKNADVIKTRENEVQ